LLLSTVERRRREGMLRRINAESAPERQFAFADMADLVERAGEEGHVAGRAGFGSIADLCAVMIPDENLSRPLALGILYEPGEATAPAALLELLRGAIAECFAPAEDNVVQFLSAA